MKNESLHADEVSFSTLKLYWELIEQLSPNEKVWLTNAFLAALSFTIPPEVWEKALERATKAVLYQRKKEEYA